MASRAHRGAAWPKNARGRSALPASRNSLTRRRPLARPPPPQLSRRWMNATSSRANVLARPVTSPLLRMTLFPLSLIPRLRRLGLSRLGPRPVLNPSPRLPPCERRVHGPPSATAIRSQKLHGGGIKTRLVVAIGEARRALSAVGSLGVVEVGARLGLGPLARVEAAAEPVLGAGKGAIMPLLALLGMRPGARHRVEERAHWPASVSTVSLAGAAPRAAESITRGIGRRTLNGRFWPGIFASPIWTHSTERPLRQALGLAPY